MKGGKVSIHDVRGRLLRTIRYSVGDKAVSWDWRDDLGEPVTSGIYFVEIDGEASSMVRKVIHLR